MKTPSEKILSGAEAASGSGQDQRAAGLVLFGRDQRSHQCGMQIGAEGIQAVGPVERQDAISGADIGQHQIVGHEHLPLWLLMTEGRGALVLNYY